MSDHYKALGVEPNATAAEIKAAYKKLATEHQQREIGTGNAELMKVINNAYDNLKTPEKRAQYDRTRSSDNFNSQARARSGSAHAESGAGYSERGKGFEEAFKRAQENAARDNRFHEVLRSAMEKNLQIEKILQTPVSDVREAHINELHLALKDNTPDNIKYKIILRAANWVRKRPELASTPHVVSMAITGVEKSLGNNLFGAIIAHAPKSFDRNDIGAIYNVISLSHMSRYVQHNFGTLCAGLVKANPDIAEHSADLAIALVERNAGNELFEAIIEAKPHAFDRNHMAVINGLMGRSFMNDVVIENFKDLKDRLMTAQSSSKNEPQPQSGGTARKPFWRFGF